MMSLRVSASLGCLARRPRRRAQTSVSCPVINHGKARLTSRLGIRVSRWLLLQSIAIAPRWLFAISCNNYKSWWSQGFYLRQHDVGYISDCGPIDDSGGSQVSPQNQQAPAAQRIAHLKVVAPNSWSSALVRNSCAACGRLDERLNYTSIRRTHLACARTIAGGPSCSDDRL
jgi:hypothetical protein